MAKRFLWGFLSVVFALAAVAEEDALVLGKNYVLKSSILKEDRPYSVYLPEACKEGGASAPCPVLYILDGDYHFHYASGMLSKMSQNGQIPDLMMVAIPNTNDRTRDLTPTHSISGSRPGEERPELGSSGGGEAFLDFVEKELIPEIEARYKPMPYRLLSGHSLGGLITLHSFIERPNLFQAHIAVDPSLWWDNQALVKRAEKYLKQTDTLRNRLFISIAEWSPKGEAGHTSMETSSERFAYALQTSPSPRLHFVLRQFKGEDHGSVVLPSLYYGLLFVFDGYKNIPPAIASQGLSAVEAYYRDYWGDYGITLTPPQSVIGELAGIAEQNGDLDTAIDYYIYNVEHHPDSATANYVLAKAYQKRGEKAPAIAFYNKALELEPKMATYINSALAALKGN